MATSIRIGTRESPLAVWQARQVQQLLSTQYLQSELVYIKSEGDTDLVTPLYALGVQGIFTKALDAALLNNRIDVAVHSMKDVPVQMATGIAQAAVLPRASFKDVLVYNNDRTPAQLGFAGGGWHTPNDAVHASPFIIATSSVRRIAQWRNRFPNTQIENLRGNVNTRLRKLAESNWHGAIFAAAGIERIGLRPANAIDINWMLPAPAQGAIVVVCRQDDTTLLNACSAFNDASTALCVNIERDFLKALMGGCSTPISGLATVQPGSVRFRGNILSPDGRQRADVDTTAALPAATLGATAAEEILHNGGDKLIRQIRHAAG